MNKQSFLFIATLLASAILATARAAGTHSGHDHGEGNKLIGKPGDAAKVSRTIRIDMADNMRFSPAGIKVKQGETIRFFLTNSGKTKHEMVIGTMQELKEHYEAMKKHPEMEHADVNQVTLAPGGKGEIIWQFTKIGKVSFACLQPGHYEAGMKGAVLVKSVKGNGASTHTHVQ